MGNLPEFLVGWRVSSEDFWKNNVSFINYLKLKASWGQMGNDAVAAFQYLTLYGFSTGIVTGSSKSYSASLLQSSTPNPKITWEVANIFNAGFESQWFDGKIRWDVDAFYQRRSNILWKKDASVPDFTGITLPDENFGIVDNKGFESVLGYSDQTGNFGYSVTANFAFARNKIIEYDERPELRNGKSERDIQSELFFSTMLSEYSMMQRICQDIRGSKILLIPTLQEEEEV